MILEHDYRSELRTAEMTWKGESFFFPTSLCYIYNSSLYNNIDNSRYFFFFGVAPSLSTKHSCAVSLADSLGRCYCTTVSRYDFRPFVWQVYALEAASLEFCYNIASVRYVWLGKTFSENPAPNDLNNENNLSSPQTRSHKVGQLWDS